VNGTAAAFGRDALAYRRLMAPLVDRADGLMEDLLAPLGVPRHPLALASFGAQGLRSAEGLARSRFEGELPRALIAGLAAHSSLALDRAGTAGFALVLGLCGHAYGWPAIRGGSGRLPAAMGAHLTALGGTIHEGRPVRGLADLPDARAVLFDVTPRQLIGIAGPRLPASYRRRLGGYRYGPGVFKIDAALSGPIPWAAPECRRAGTVHVGGMLGEIAAAEAAVASGRHADRPFVIVAQQSLFDSRRAPTGRQTAWMYCHVPSGSTRDMTEAIEGQVERFAPGYRDLILARHVTGPAAQEAYNANCVGGDINGGIQDLRQLLTRPVARWSPYTTPDRGLYICSSSTPPGGGVHGMCGYHAARAALQRSF
jgi:phytoene dehydrogenase-like protein